MELGDAAEALRAKAELAKRHAETMRRQAHEQRETARLQREAEARAVRAARAAVDADAEELRCERCHAVWRREAVVESTRRKPCCLLCGGPLAPVP